MRSSLGYPLSLISNIYIFFLQKQFYYVVYETHKTSNLMFNNIAAK